MRRTHGIYFKTNQWWDLNRGRYPPTFAKADGGIRTHGLLFIPILSKFAQSLGGDSNSRSTVYKTVVPISPKVRQEPGVGFEPTTYALQKRCSTVELSGRTLVEKSRILDPDNSRDRGFTPKLPRQILLQNRGLSIL